ncbi:MAG: cellobiose phosphorylase [Candidatus Omnitrophica bacterium]|nr:cellobiose phosphorylase [Candidatus Omnitrophota bacterium]
MISYRLDRDSFVIEDYLRARPFASFLPGIAGVWGIPMWVFYVNRGQGIAGFGTQNKDHPIMEFLPANKAYRATPQQGFRTFVKLSAGRRQTVYEPFRASATGKDSATTQRMRIRRHELELEERHHGLNLETRVQYFTIPHEPFAALARVLTLTNRGRAPLALELLDGLPAIIPYGMQDYFLKNMSRTIEAWVRVDNVGRRAPFFRLKVEPHDRPEVVPIHAGNFYVACAHDGTRSRLLEPIVDPALIFGCHEDFTIPERFLDASFRAPAHQLVSEKTPCAMGYLKTALRPGESRTVASLFGHIQHLKRLNALLAAITSPDFFLRKRQENQQLIDQITQPIATASGLPAFDLYCRQTFLDNVMRGGAPAALGGKTLYVFGRKHGDLERDYNQFVVPATPFSQGNANYRDVNQNRRTDAWFYPQVGESTLIAMFNLLQADGFNPLIYKGLRFLAPAEELHRYPALGKILSKPFTPGELLDHISRCDVKLSEPPEQFLPRIIARARAVEDAEHGEGFWTDHWTYNLDLLESYLALYPDRLRALLLEERVFTFYDNTHVVLPRAKKYVLAKGVARQFHAVRLDPEKHALVHGRTEDPHRMRAEHGRGPVYTTTLAVKMLAVIANKLASLDPSGLGIEMEADKPNWYDALNGLPGLFGSSLCETFELKRWMQCLSQALAARHPPLSASIAVPEELAAFISQLEQALAQPQAQYWEASASAKEAYREQIRLGWSGQEDAFAIDRLLRFLQAGIGNVSRGIAKSSAAAGGLPLSYFTHEALAYAESTGPHPAITLKRRRSRALPLFLEGLVHALRQEPRPAKARALYRAARKSPLYDARLKMYRVCELLTKEPEDIGRCRVFSPGWLEHASIWLHMEYKFLLELLRCGLHEEFYEEFFNALIPFQPPARYGRSILENSSFLVSSAHADASLHGAGFVARLSGATAEFLQMWLWMMVGRAPFQMNPAFSGKGGVNSRGQLELRFAPILHGKLFDQAGRLSFTFLGATRVTYRNPWHRSTFGAKAVQPSAAQLTLRDGRQVDIPGGIIPAPYAEQIRQGEAASIEMTLAAAGAASSRAPR